MHSSDQSGWNILRVKQIRMCTLMLQATSANGISRLYLSQKKQEAVSHSVGGVVVVCC